MVQGFGFQVTLGRGIEREGERERKEREEGGGREGGCVCGGESVVSGGGYAVQVSS